MNLTLQMLDSEIATAKRNVLSALESVERTVREIRRFVEDEDQDLNFSGEDIRAMANAVIEAQRWASAVRARRLIRIEIQPREPRPDPGPRGKLRKKSAA